MQATRRTFLLTTAAALLPLPALALDREVWPADEAHRALSAGRLRMIDVRTRDEWRMTGLAQGTWAISMHEKRFQDRLFAAHALAGKTPVALICATGGRSGRLLRALKRAGFDGFIDVSEGMMGSRRGPGWIARGLPLVDLTTALKALPPELA